MSMAAMRRALPRALVARRLRRGLGRPPRAAPGRRLRVRAHRAVPARQRDLGSSRRRTSRGSTRRRSATTASSSTVAHRRRTDRLVPRDVRGGRRSRVTFRWTAGCFGDWEMRYAVDGDRSPGATSRPCRRTTRTRTRRSPRCSTACRGRASETRHERRQGRGEDMRIRSSTRRILAVVASAAAVLATTASAGKAAFKRRSTSRRTSRARGLLRRHGLTVSLDFVMDISVHVVPKGRDRSTTSSRTARGRRY